MPPPLTDGFAALSLVQEELEAYKLQCECGQKIEVNGCAVRRAAMLCRQPTAFPVVCACGLGEPTTLPLASQARRAELHASLDRVLVIDMRFFWNGVGNSLPRWLASLRVGLAAGRATFLWMSDRGFSDTSAATGRRLATERAIIWKRPAARPERPERVARALRRGEARAGLVAAPTGFNRSERRSRPAPWRRDPSRTPTAPYSPPKSNGFDLGEFFLAAGADWRWDRHSYARVRAALATRNQSQVPYLARYYCRRHTWACNQPRFEYGPAGSSETARPFPPGMMDGTQFGGPTVRDTGGGAGGGGWRACRAERIWGGWVRAGKRGSARYCRGAGWVAGWTFPPRAIPFLFLAHIGPAAVRHRRLTWTCGLRGLAFQK